MEREDEDPLVLDHYVRNLNSDIRRKFEDFLSLKRVEKNDVSYQISSLEELVKICIIFDVARMTVNPTSSISHSNSKSSSDSERKSSYSHDHVKPKYCSFHKTNTHSTNECRQAHEQKSSTQSSSHPSSSRPASSKTNDKSNVRCFKCGSMGHYSNECTKPSSTSNSSGSGSSSSSTQVRRPNNPPDRLTYTQLGQQGPKTDVANKSVVMNTGVSNIPTGKTGRVWLYDPVKNRHFGTLVDTGADVSFIDSALAKKLGIPISPAGPGNVTLAHADITTPREGVTGDFNLTAILSFDESEIAVKQISHKFELMKLDTSQYSFVIGADLLPLLFPISMPVGFYSKQKSEDGSLFGPSVRRIGVTIIDQLVENVNSGVVDNTRMLDEMVGFGSLPAEEVREQASVSTPPSLEQEYSVHRESILNDPLIVEQIRINEQIQGFCSLEESVVRLEVSDEFEKSGFRKQYGVPHAAEQAVTEQIEKWLAAGKIELAPTNCPFNSSLTVATKKDSFGNFVGWRICLDTRALNNAISGSDRFQLPYIRDVLERFHGCKFFGEVDLSEAYLQFSLHPDSRKYTAFTWKGRQYVFIGCPFGIALLPSWFQRAMCGIFYDLLFVIPYLDNFPFGSNTLDEHKKHLLLILIRCNQHNLKIKLSALKCSHSEMRCLGHLLTNSGVKLSPTKVECISNYERPITGKQLQSFLGAVTFLRPNIRHMSEISASLEAAKNTSGELVWSDRMIEDFELVKKAISSAPGLCYPDFNKPFHIATDASNIGVGGVLYQPDEVGGDITAGNIVSIVSKKLSGSQYNYPAYKKELLGIVYCLRQFHQYIWGQPDLVIFTDHKPLTHLLNQRELTPAVQQWLDVLLDYSFEIRYREGKLNILPDHLSRLYASEYTDIWGVPSRIPWKFPVDAGAVAAPDSGVKISVAGVEVENSNSDQSLVGGENAEALTNNDKLIEALIEMEKRGMIIPTTEEEKIKLIETQHAFGHFGREATCSGLIKKGIWWSGMRNDIAREISKCDPCTRFTVVRNGFNPSSYITADGPWCHIQLDTSVHLPAAPGGFTALLVIIDVFTGFIILRPIKTTSAEIIAYEFWLVCCTFGLPKIIQSDNGPEFVNNVIRSLVKLTGVDHRFISPYNPRADGKVERSIQTVMSTIKKLLHGNEQNWTLYVPFAQLSFNNKVAALTGSTPFSLMFGRSLNEIKDYTEDEKGLVVDIENWKSHMEKVQSLIYPAILDRTMVSKNKMIKALDSKRRLLTSNSFPVGAIVMLRDPLRQNKFEAKYIGPYSIVRRTRNGNYQLKDGTGDFLERHIPPDQLKLVSKKPRKQDTEEQEYVVQYIVNHRGQTGAYEYETKFKGFPVPEWIPAENFVDTECISKYWKSINQPNPQA
jgi:hypothetical protein